MPTILLGGRPFRLVRTRRRPAENDKRNADFRISVAQEPSARALREARAAEATAREEARGAGLVNSASS
jgi:hypothetical protein